MNSERSERFANNKEQRHYPKSNGLIRNIWSFFLFSLSHPSIIHQLNSVALSLILIVLQCLVLVTKVRWHRPRLWLCPVCVLSFDWNNFLSIFIVLNIQKKKHSSSRTNETTVSAVVAVTVHTVRSFWLMCVNVFVK